MAVGSFARVFGATAALAPDSVAVFPSAGQRIADLRVQIAHHNTLYFEKAAPEISDAQFDELKRELVRLEQAFPDAARLAAPLPAISDDRTPGFESVRHREPMLSLEKAYSEQELRGFLQRVRKIGGKVPPTFVVEPKFDGIAVSVTYEQGELVRVVTRGDGREGDDVTANALAIRDLPRRLRSKSSDGTLVRIPHKIELRGEVFLSTAEFQRINREQEAAGEPTFAHPRNLAAGTLKLHDPAAVADRRLSVVFFGWGAVSPAAAVPATQHEFHALTRAWGLPGIDGFTPARTDDEVWAAVRTLDRSRSRLGFPIDGAVIKINQSALHLELGASDAAPRWAIAYKFVAERAETTLIGVTWQVGRSGVLTPVAELAPVRLGGATITRASLHNRDEIVRRDLRIGDTVILEKAGEIVPQIIGVNLARRTAASRPFVFPAACPECETTLMAEGQVASVRCPNRNCPAQVRRRLEHFASKGAVDIAGLGPAMIETLVVKGWVKELPDLYRLERAQLLTLGRNVEVSTGKLLAAIEASKRAELWRFIHGLGIPRVGSVTARELAAHFGSLEALMAAGESSASGHSRGVPPTEATTRAVSDFFSEPRQRAMIADLTLLGVKPTNKEEP